MKTKPKSAADEAADVKPQTTAVRLPTGEEGKGRVFLIDAMSFIFRAYHAMARQRPMSTKKGLPTSATYVFVNMLSKLRKDFAPEYIAAVFDVAAPTFRDEQDPPCQSAQVRCGNSELSAGSLRRLQGETGRDAGRLGTTSSIY